MPVQSLEVADIFCAHGAVYRAANAGDISLNRFKVMSAIERCRTAVLGGHVARCADCAREHSAYNSCRNYYPEGDLAKPNLPRGRHCPKCQAGAAKTWLAAREAERLPVRYFHLVFTLPKQIAPSRDIAAQCPTGLVDRAAFDTFVQPLRQIDWVVYAKDPFAGPKAVLAYLSRYTHRIAISNSRLIRFGERSVTFCVKDYRLKGAGRHTTMTLATHEFIRRFLIHVLPRGQHRIRHYGFYGNGNRAANITRIRQLLGAKTPDPQHIDEADKPPRTLALPCPCCGGQLIIVETIAPSQHPRAPPDPKRAAA